MAAVRAAALGICHPGDEHAVTFQNYLPVPFQTALPNTVCELDFRHGCSLTEAGARSVSQPPVPDVGCR